MYAKHSFCTQKSEAIPVLPRAKLLSVHRSCPAEFPQVMVFSKKKIINKIMSFFLIYARQIEITEPFCARQKPGDLALMPGVYCLTYLSS